uniref:Uncharacterized protein n=1 Tax=Physcomitrium patens TaxID=3218 RepID=A0A7I4BUT3_PHYPA
MGGVCPGCLRASAQEDKLYHHGYQYPPFPQQPLPRPVQQRPRPQVQQQQQQKPQQQQRTREEDLARSDEARANAAIAAQKRGSIREVGRGKSCSNRNQGCQG